MACKCLSEPYASAQGAYRRLTLTAPKRMRHLISTQRVSPLRQTAQEVGDHLHVGGKLVATDGVTRSGDVGDL